jgi:hypothetical protein
MTETERRENNPGCSARQFSDEMVCTTCRLRWDVNDPEPPACNPEQKSSARVTILRRAGKLPNPSIWRR